MDSSQDNSEKKRTHLFIEDRLLKELPDYDQRTKRRIAIELTLKRRIERRLAARYTPEQRSKMGPAYSLPFLPSRAPESQPKDAEAIADLLADAEAIVEVFGTHETQAIHRELPTEVGPSSHGGLVQGRPHLLKIPGELRNRIYAMVLPDGGYEMTQPPLTGVCKIIRRETLPMWFGTIEFTVQAGSHTAFCSFEKGMDNIVDGNEGSIRSITVITFSGPITIVLKGHNGALTREVYTARMFFGDSDGDEAHAATIEEHLDGLSRGRSEWALDQNDWIFLVHLCCKGRWLQAPPQGISSKRCSSKEYIIAQSGRYVDWQEVKRLWLMERRESEADRQRERARRGL